MGKTLFGDDESPVWVALIVEKAGLPHPSVEDIQEQVRRHWHRGILLLQAEWENCAAENSEGVYERFILFLAQRAGLPAHGSGGAAIDDGPEAQADRRAVPIRVRLGDPGTDEKTGQPATWLLNGKGSPHVALMGSPGTGKTRLARHALGQIREQSAVPCLVFDFKGDLAADAELVRTLGATVVRPPVDAVPLDILFLPDRAPIEVSNVATRFRDSFASLLGNRAGAVQRDALRDAAQAAVTKARPGKPADIAAVRDELLAVYAQTTRKADAVTSTFNDLTQAGWKLFDPRLKPAEFFARSWIVDAHGATDTAQRLVVFLILDALYAHYKALPDSAMDAQNHRALRMVLVVDEARRVLSYRQPSLVGLVRESRSKGMSVFLISQSPEDFDTDAEDFLDNIGLTVCFRANGGSARVLRACLGQTVDLAGLPNGVAVCRLPGQSGVSRIQAWE